jgi:hypothetical protein
MDREFVKPKDQRRYDDFVMYLKITSLTFFIVYFLVRGIMISGFLNESNQKYKLQKRTRLEKIIDNVVNEVKSYHIFN